MVRKEGGKGKMALVYKDQWLLAVTSEPAAKEAAKDLDVASAGPAHCHPPTTISLQCAVLNNTVLVHYTRSFSASISACIASI